MLQPSPLLVSSRALDGIGGSIAIGLVAAAAIVAVALVVGLVLLFRRRAGAQPSGAAGLDQLRTRAGVLLVRADEAVTAATDELGFAEAQFGADRTAGFASALAGARTQLAEAFRLQQALDDSRPDSVRERREWMLRIGALCESAIAVLDREDTGFSRLRDAEADSPARITALRARIDLAAGRLGPVGDTLDRIARGYAPRLVAGRLSAVDDARDALGDASARVEAAAAESGPRSPRLEAAEAALRRATALLDGVESLAGELAGAASALDALVDSSLTDLTEARTERDAAPDADSGAAIIAAMREVEDTRYAIVSASGPRDPAADLDTLAAAVASLDTALASARNQSQRLEHARAALVGTLASASAQVAALRALIAAGGRSVGAEARTRLAEADRQLALARAEPDPVEALDAARRAVTHARDGDALAHYDAMTGRR